jgi:hypothetical protein
MLFCKGILLYLFQYQDRWMRNTMFRVYVVIVLSIYYLVPKKVRL